MLPFLKKDQDASVSAPVETVERDHDETYGGLHAAADDLILAVHAKDTKGVAAALKAAFELCDSQPHEKGEHI